MALRNNGVIGGPRRTKPIRPKMKPGFFPKKDEPEVIVQKVDLENQPETFLISSDGEQTTLAFSPPEEPVEVVEEVDPIEEEDKEPTLDELFPVFEPVVEAPIVDKLTCNLCGFRAKSKKGLKSHKKWKHSTIEGF